MDLKAFMDHFCDFIGCGCCSDHSSSEVEQVNRLLELAGSPHRVKICTACNRRGSWLCDDVAYFNEAQYVKCDLVDCPYKNPGNRYHDCPPCKGTELELI